MRPVEETGCGLASPPLEEMTSRSSGDAQPGAGRELEVLPEENPGGGLAPGSSIGPRSRPETSGERSSATRENIDGTSRLPPGVTLTGDQICQVDGSIIPRITQLMADGSWKCKEVPELSQLHQSQNVSQCERCSCVPDLFGKIQLLDIWKHNIVCTEHQPRDAHQSQTL